MECFGCTWSSVHYTMRCLSPPPLLPVARALATRVQPVNLSQGSGKRTSLLVMHERVAGMRRRYVCSAAIALLLCMLRSHIDRIPAPGKDRLATRSGL